MRLREAEKSVEECLGVFFCQMLTECFLHCEMSSHGASCTKSIISVCWFTPTVSVLGHSTHEQTLFFVLASVRQHFNRLRVMVRVWYYARQCIQPVHVVTLHSTMFWKWADSHNILQCMRSMTHAWNCSSAFRHFFTELRLWGSSHGSATVNYTQFILFFLLLLFKITVTMSGIFN